MRLLIVDDSALMRRMLSECFSDQTDIELVTARDGADALKLAQEFQPDVITLDINMPKMDGLTCLAHLSEVWPCPVIMVSSLTEKGALATFEALELGAVDFVAKPGGTVSLNMEQIFDDLRQKVRAAALSQRAKTRRAAAPAAKPKARRPEPSPEPAPELDQSGGAVDLVMIGCSTGGPRTLSALLPALPGDFPAPVLIAQHMPDRFTGVLAKRLANSCALDVQELRSATPLEPGCAYIAAGGMDVEVVIQFNRIVGRPVEACDSFTWHPSVARMVSSAMSALAPERCLSVMLTGMGDDGATEMTELQKRGGRTIAESEASAAIFGMPQRLIELGGASKTLHADQIPQQLVAWTAGSTTKRTRTCR